jgi:hypothetical protein
MGYMLMNIVVISVTSDCCFKCKGCISKSVFNPCGRGGRENSMSVRTINLEQLYKFVSSNLSGWKIIITGGEPFMVSGISFFLNRIAETNDVCVMTNNFYTEEIIGLLDERIKIIATWHPDMVKFDRFFNHHKPELKDRLLFKYLLHPRHIESGDAERHLELFPKPPLLGYFRGEWNGEQYNFLHPVYNNYRQYLKLETSARIMTVDTGGNIGKCWERQATIADSFFNFEALTRETCHFGCSLEFTCCPNEITALQAWGDTQL